MDLNMTLVSNCLGLFVISALAATNRKNCQHCDAKEVMCVQCPVADRPALVSEAGILDLGTTTSNPKPYTLRKEN